MKDIKPGRDPELIPATFKTERPDNGTRSNREFGPSSEAHKDNAHKRLDLARHAGLMTA